MYFASNVPGGDPDSNASAIRIEGWRGLLPAIRSTLRFWTQTEVHVYAFSIAANVLLSFFPFLLTIILVCRSVFHWEAGVGAVLYAVQDYFPDYHGGGYLDIAGWLMRVAARHRGLSYLSILFLFITANGIFEPLEVALNRAWHVRKNRSYLGNQLVSLGLIFLCGALVLVSAGLTAWDRQFFGASAGAGVVRGVVFKLVALPVSMLMIFLIYWLLPNRRVPARRLIPVSVMVGLALEALKYIDLLTWPLLQAKLRNEMEPFTHSVSIILWSFCGAMILLAGAEWSARSLLAAEDATKTDEERVG